MKVGTSLSAAIVLIALGLVACQMPGGGGPSNPTVVNKSIKLNDGNGNFIGYVTEVDNFFVRIYTSKGYFVTIDWTGVFADGEMLFTGTGGTGTMFLESGGGEVVGFVDFMYGQPYVAATVDSFGGAATDPSLTTFLSHYSDGTTTSYGSPQSLKPGAIGGTPMKIATFADIGVPSSISPPLHLVFE